MKENKAFETERLIVKLTSEEDAEFILELLNTPKWIKYIGDRNVKSVDSARDYILKRITSQYERLGYANYTLIRKSDNVKIGTCGLYDREGLKGIDIGFAFLPEYEGKGYAFEAASLILDLALNLFGIRELNAITVKENIPSQKLLEKLGLKLIGTTKLPDEDEELLLYNLKR